MQRAVPQVTNRGVFCSFCGKPIRLSVTFIRRESAIQRNGSSVQAQLSSKVFPARCRACNQETIYFLAQVTDFMDGDLV